MPGRQQQAQAALERLTDREREVVIAVGQGKTNTEIADDIYISSATAKAHASKLVTKLQVNNRTQIALLAHDAYPDR
ncbi:response regulator transcription factor [Amycolatopsis sp. H20-H5]|uniref:response regulator transcription factor n=1 Tax=Amycolatopsis sp. H20-H5 TaxID=3046309 RepID=UPI002DB5F801|nr:LuxR C-terminal-related transcriptional regulator [Amycolatopsis sp. H20-H5]MEC3974996.1 LuxR C-terminal-related transcriptional regulator [Amycolatopsis sp. H20-H5]